MEFLSYRIGRTSIADTAVMGRCLPNCWLIGTKQISISKVILSHQERAV